MAGILKVVQRIVPSDLRRANSMISGALKSGYKKGSIYAMENKITGVRKTYTKSKSAVKELKTLRFSKEDIPGRCTNSNSGVKFYGLWSWTRNSVRN